MPKRLRFTRRLPVSLTEDAYRRLRRFALDSELSQDEALVFFLEHFVSVTDEAQLAQRLRLFKAELAEKTP